jgi:predicted phage terminase large subunit-like protein
MEPVAFQKLVSQICPDFNFNFIPKTQTFSAWLPEVSPEFTWDWKYLVYLREQLDRVTRGEIKRLMVFAPPRHGKSEMTTIRYPVYRMEQDPALRVILAAYSADLASKFSRKCRRLAESRFDLAQDSKSVSDWETASGGGMRAVGVGGGVTGMGGNLILLDDCIKSREEAESQRFRDRVYDWYVDDIYSRLEPNGAIIIINTRWHLDDLCGRILASDDAPNWTVVSLPALAEDDDPLGRELGEALCPERFDEEDLASIKRVQTRNFDTLYQQRPVAASGDMIKLGWLSHTYKSMPFMKQVRTNWDTAQTENERNDESASCTLGEGEDGNLYLLAAKFGRWETPQLASNLISQATRLRTIYGSLYKGDYVENKSNGTALTQFLRSSNPELVIVQMNTKGDKVAKTNAITPLLESGRLKVPDLTIYPQARSWFDGLKTQMLAFPNAAHDDRHDALVMGLLRYMKQYTTPKPSKTARGGFV